MDFTQLIKYFFLVALKSSKEARELLTSKRGKHSKKSTDHTAQLCCFLNNSLRLTPQLKAHCAN